MPRDLKNLATVTTLMIATILIGPFSAMAQATGLQSDGIGLSRDAWEETYGEGEVLQSLVRYKTAKGFPLYVGFEDERVAHIEFRYSEGTQLGGLAEDDVIAQVERVLPGDAILINEFVVPATPEGPVALRAQRWGSNALGYVTGGETSILVIYQEKRDQQNPGSDPEIVIPAVTLTVAEPASGR